MSKTLQLIQEYITRSKVSNIYLRGPIGAGKTHTAKKIISCLTGIEEEEIRSPTFSLLHEYHTNNRSIFHYDLYRIKEAYDLERINVLEHIMNPKHITIIEWPELIYKEIDAIEHLLIQIDKNHQIKIEKEKFMT